MTFMWSRDWRGTEDYFDWLMQLIGAVIQYVEMEHDYS
jgi:hypothetical protein